MKSCPLVTTKVPKIGPLSWLAHSLLWLVHSLPQGKQCPDSVKPLFPLRINRGQSLDTFCAPPAATPHPWRPGFSLGPLVPSTRGGYVRTSSFFSCMKIVAIGQLKKVPKPTHRVRCSSKVILCFYRPWRNRTKGPRAQDPIRTQLGTQSGTQSGPSQNPIRTQSGTSQNPPKAHKRPVVAWEHVVCLHTAGARAAQGKQWTNTVSPLFPLRMGDLDRPSVLRINAAYRIPIAYRANRTCLYVWSFCGPLGLHRGEGNPLPQGKQCPDSVNPMFPLRTAYCVLWLASTLLCLAQNLLWLATAQQQREYPQGKQCPDSVNPLFPLRMGWGQEGSTPGSREVHRSQKVWSLCRPHTHTCSIAILDGQKGPKDWPKEAR